MKFSRWNSCIMYATWGWRKFMWFCIQRKGLRTISSFTWRIDVGVHSYVIGIAKRLSILRLVFYQQIPLYYSVFSGNHVAISLTRETLISIFNNFYSFEPCIYKSTSRTRGIIYRHMKMSLYLQILKLHIKKYIYSFATGLK